MIVRALAGFSCESGVREAGEEFEMADSVAIVRIQQGLVVRVGESVDVAALEPPETAVRRKRGR